MIRISISKALTAAALMLCLVPAAHAQRQTMGRPSIEGQVIFGEAMDYKKVAVNGGSVTWNNYQYLGHTSIGLEFYTHPYDFVTVEDPIYDKDGSIIFPGATFVDTYRSFDITVGGGYFIRVLSTRNRALIFSVGASAYLGVRYCKEISSYVKDETTGKHYGSVGFLINIIPEAQLEVFPFSNVSLFASARPRFQVWDTMAGKYNWFRFTWGGGLKYYF